MWVADAVSALHSDSIRSAADTNTNTSTNTRDDIYSAVICGASHMREFTLGHLGESRSASGGRPAGRPGCRLDL